MWGYIVGTFLIAGLAVWFFTGWQTHHTVEHLTNEERMAALERVVKFARRMR